MPDGVLFGLIWAAVIVGLWFIGRVVAKRRPNYAADRPDLAYAPFTREYDLVLPSADVPGMLAADGVAGESPRGASMADLDARVARFEATTTDSVARLDALNGRLYGQAFCFLLDLSGSTVGRLPEVLAELRAIHSWLIAHEARCSVLGFTTRGWRGGLARQKWAADGRPSYPGRLCALMHVEVAPFGQATQAGDWTALLSPDILRENIDGEAIRWAADLLAHEPAQRRRLFVLSDGAPVDDSTLAENGRTYLWRDLIDAIGEVEKSGDIELVGVGLSHRVEAVYGTSAYRGDGANLIDALMPIILDDRSDEPTSEGFQ